MTADLKPLGIGLLAGLTLGAVVGRFTAPTKVETKTVEVVKTVTVEAKAEEHVAVTATDKDTAHVTRRKTTDRIAPAAPASGPCPACPEVREHIVEEEVADTTSDDTTQGTAEATQATHTTDTERRTETVTIRETMRPSWRLEAQAGWSRAQPAPDLWGGAVSHRLVGPVAVGVWGRSDKTGGITVGIDF